MLIVVYVEAFIIVMMSIMLLIILKNEERAVNRERILENQIKSLRFRGNELERKNYQQECEKNNLEIMLDNEKTIREITNEELSFYKAHCNELEKIISNERNDVYENATEQASN